MGVGKGSPRRERARGGVGEKLHRRERTRGGEEGDGGREGGRRRRKSGCGGGITLPCRGIQYRMDLSSVEAGKVAVVKKIDLPPLLRYRLQALNLAEGKRVRVVRIAPFGGVRMFEAEGVRFALRADTARKIFVEVLP